MAFEGARAYRSTDFSVPNDSWTAIDLSAERWDTDNMWEGVSRPDRLYVNTAGKYLFVLLVSWYGDVNGNRMIGLYLNDTTWIGLSNDKALAAGGNSMIVSSIWDCSVDDFVSARAWQDSGDALNILTSAQISPEFMAQRLDA